MNLEEIKKQIDENNAAIQSLITPAIFVLNDKVMKLMKENEELQKKCTHEFVDKKCKYCYQEEQ